MGVRLVAALVAIIGGVNFLTALQPSTDIAHLATPIDGAAPGRAQMFVLGLLLLTVARGLIHERWAAYVGSVATLTVAIVIALPERRPYAVIMAGTALVVLVVFRHRFRTRPDPDRLRLAGQIALVALGVAIIGGGWDAYANRSAGVSGAGRVIVADLSTANPESWRAELLMVALAAAVIAAVIVALSPASAPQPGDADDRAAVGRLAAQPGADSLAPFATRADKAYVFSPDRRSAIGYRVIMGTALVGGDPVGASGAAAAAMRAFLALCTAHGWRPAVLGASDEMTLLWRDMGLRGMHIGDEAVLDVDEFSLATRRMRNLRQAVNRTRNAGVTVTIARLDAGHATALEPILEHWLRGERERGFAMNLGAILTPRPDCLVATAYAATGEPVAFARFAVCADGTVYTLDVAPRGRNAPNGVAERMIIEIVDYAREHGGREVSLNFAAMRWIFDSPGIVARTCAAFVHALDRWIEVEALNRFCAKFSPGWRGRHLLMRSWLELGWVGAAALRAELSATPVTAPSLEPVFSDECIEPRTGARHA